mmetsp:Transcript_12339/g.49518  ORF Transcript_12339/g.49518 Transcript_12339/m.49518 type:complete len:215 (-) Transcript_12339:115-759(-)
MARSFLVVACLFSAIVLASAARPNPHDGLALKLSRHNLGTEVASDLGHVLSATESLSTPQCDAAYKILNNDKSPGGYIETVEKIFAIARAVGKEAGAVCGAHLKVRWDSQPVYCKQSCQDFWTPERMAIVDEVDAAVTKVLPGGHELVWLHESVTLPFPPFPLVDMKADFDAIVPVVIPAACQDAADMDGILGWYSAGCRDENPKLKKCEFSYE